MPENDFIDSAKKRIASAVDFVSSVPVRIGNYLEEKKNDLLSALGFDKKKQSSDVAQNLLSPVAKSEVNGRIGRKKSRTASTGRVSFQPGGPSSVPLPRVNAGVSSPDVSGVISSYEAGRNVDSSIPRVINEVSPIVVPGSDERIAGDLDVVEEKFVGSNSPTGHLLYFNYSNNPKLKDKPPYFLFLSHGDGGRAEEMIDRASMMAEESRRAGVNVVLVSFQSVGSHDWGYLGNSGFDKIAKFCFEKCGDGKIGFAGFSGGYRPMALLAKSAKEYRDRIDSFCLFDATYPDSRYNIEEQLLSYAKGGAKVLMFTQRPLSGVNDKGRPRDRTVRLADSIMSSAGANPNFKHIRTSHSHWGVYRDPALWGAYFASLGGVSSGERAVAASNAVKAVNSPGASDILREEPRKMEFFTYLQSVAQEVEKVSKNFRHGGCYSYMTDFVTSLVKKLTGNPPSYPRYDGETSSDIAFAPIHKEATSLLRGLKVKSLNSGYFSNLPAGLVFFLNIPDVYTGKNGIYAGSSNKLSSLNSLGPNQKRHWFIFAGMNRSGEPVFIDNRGHNHNLSFVNGHYGGDRVVVNVLDPLKAIRENLVANNGAVQVKQTREFARS